jgi:hypothetical protein
MTGMVVILGAVGAALAWWAYRIVSRRRIDEQFRSHVSGGRSGEMIISCNGRKARAEYEIGGKVNFIVYESSLAWADNTSITAAERDAIANVLTAWMQARGSSVEIANDAQQATVIESDF